MASRKALKKNVNYIAGELFRRMPYEQSVCTRNRQEES